MSVDTKSSKSSNVFLGLTILFIILVTIIGVWLLQKNSSSVKATRLITYEVESTGGYALIVFTDYEGHKTDPKMVPTPWSKTFNLPVGIEVYLTASNPSQMGNVICRIKIDNRDWKQSKGNHPVDSVACGGIIR